MTSAQRRLDRLCEELLLSRPSAKVKHSMIMAMGACLGELIIRATRGRWSYDVDLREAVVETGDGVMGWPHTRVAKHLEVDLPRPLHTAYVKTTAGPRQPPTHLAVGVAAR